MEASSHIDIAFLWPVLLIANVQMPTPVQPVLIANQSLHQVHSLKREKLFLRYQAMEPVVEEVKSHQSDSLLKSIPIACPLKKKISVVLTHLIDFLGESVEFFPVNGNPLKGRLPNVIKLKE